MDPFDLDCISQKSNLLFKFLNNYQYLGMEDLPRKFFIENSSINEAFPNNKTGEIAAKAYLVSFTEI